MLHNAREVVAIVTHGILSRNVIETLNKSKLSRVIVTNTVPIQGKMEACEKLEIVDISPALAEAVRKTHNEESVNFCYACGNGLVVVRCALCCRFFWVGKAEGGEVLEELKKRGVEERNRMVSSNNTVERRFERRKINKGIAVHSSNNLIQDRLADLCGR